MTTSRNPLIRVVTVSQDMFHGNLETDEELVKYTMERLEWASAYEPDIGNLPENWNGKKPEEVPGPTTEILSKWAKETSCYVISPMRTRAGDRIFNSSVLIDRNGEIVGQYNKVRITEGEIKDGVCPGDPDVPVFKTDFGTIGMQICWDAAWPENWKLLKGKGADIVFISSAYPAARQVAVHAWTNEFYVVSATKTRKSSIFNITGDIIDSSGSHRKWAQATLPLKKRLLETDFHGDKLRQVEKRYGRRVQVEYFHEDDWATVASLDPELSIEEIFTECGLVSLTDYHARASSAMDKVRAEMNSKNKQ